MTAHARLEGRADIVRETVLAHSAVVEQRFIAEGRRRLLLTDRCNRDPSARIVAMSMYKLDPVAWINDWVWLYEPRNPGRGLPVMLPLTLRPRQVEYVRWIQDLRRQRLNGLTEKSRDEGMTWVVIAYYLHAWLFENGFKGGLGSRKLDLVDKLGQIDTLFEKCRFILRNLPRWMRPKGFNERLHSKEALLLNPENENSIAGEGGDNIGRGGRSSIYFVDEHAKVPKADSVHAALSQNTDVIIYGSTPHGHSNLFARIAHGRIPGEPWPKFTFHWLANPDKNYGLQVLAKDGHGVETIYPWYLFERSKSVDLPLFEQEVDISYDAEKANQVILGAWVQAARRIGKLEHASTSQAGLDVSDAGKDKTVYASRSGGALKRVQRLIGQDTPQQVHALACEDGVDSLQYDRLGVGAGISKTLGLREDLPYEIHGIANSEKPTRTVYEDNEAPARERFTNLAAELWWRLRLRFQRTWERVEQGIAHPDDECISLSELPDDVTLNTLMAQLSQATYARAGTSDKIRVNKEGEDGGTSPDHAEGVMYAFAPPRQKQPRKQRPVKPPTAMIDPTVIGGHRSGGWRS